VIPPKAKIHQRNINGWWNLAVVVHTRIIHLQTGENICKQKQPYVNLSLLFFSSSRYFSKLCSPKVSSSLCDLLQVDVCALQRKYNTSGNTENVTEDPDSPAKHASSVLNQIITIPDTPHLVLKIEIYDGIVYLMANILSYMYLPSGKL
jgi:hypothetical protein